MSYKDIIRKAMVGEQYKLLSTGEVLSIWPQKLPQRIADEINEIQVAALQQDGMVDGVRTYRAAVRKAEEEKRDLTEEEQLNLLPSLPSLPKGMRDKIARLCLTYGIGKHDWPLDGEGGKLICDGIKFDEDAIVAILDWGPVAEEIMEVVTQHNRPLQKKKQETSGA